MFIRSGAAPSRRPRGPGAGPRPAPCRRRIRPRVAGRPARSRGTGLAPARSGARPRRDSTYEKLIDVGEHVVVLLRNHGRREDMETEVELIGATILTFREAKLARWGDYVERTAALEAVGLSEQDAQADS